MLEVKNISKTYKTGDLKQVALDDVSLCFRDNEFVSILGPSGSGKTTLLNIIGGLDRYDTGDLIINNISTKKYKNKDWDSYRNHTVGFVFQSYNLIPHQTILSNVELALTISGISRRERKKRALKALEEVGLKEQAHKKPNQMSGGQMQRVAVARALVNNPSILLADEPTGALDSETSLQVMDLLKKIAKDRLVVMVTHNPELAEEYSTRIVKLKDGRITDDSNKFEITEKTKPHKYKNLGKSSMSIFTAFGLSLNNLLTKKGRTILTAFAGSIGIIGIALISALSNGFQKYIDKVQEDALTSYPLTVEQETADPTKMLLSTMTNTTDKKAKEKDTVLESKNLENMLSSVGKNDMKSFKKYIEENDKKVKSLTTNVSYGYSVVPNIYTKDVNNKLTQINPSSLFESLMSTSATGMSIFQEIPGNEKLMKESYTLLKGKYPKKYNELMIVLPDEDHISDILLYSIGLKDSTNVDNMISKIMAGEKIDSTGKEKEISFDELLNVDMRLILSADKYRYNSKYNLYEDMTEDSAYMENLYKDAVNLKIVGIVKMKDANGMSAFLSGVGYTPKLTDYVIEQTKDKAVVKQQLDNKNINVFSGKSFDDKSTSSGMDFDELISVDTDMLSQAFNVKIDEEYIKSTTEGYMEEINNAISSDTSVAKARFLTTFSDIFKGLLNDYIDNHEIITLPDSATINLDEVDSIVDNYFATDHPKELLQSLENEYMIPKEAYETVYKEIIKNFLKAYINLTGSDSAVITKTAVDTIVDTIVTTNGVPEMADEFAKNMQDANMKATILPKVGELTAKLMETMAKAFNVDQSKIAGAFKFNLTEDDIKRVFSAMTTTTKADANTNLITLGYQERNNPSTISFYFKDFAAKEDFIKFLDNYNKKMKKIDKEKVIEYTDITGVMISSVKIIVDSVSYVLIAFVSISLIVSSIMIGIITYISVLERTKEIGILRAIGASKRNISSIFNAETFIIGFLSGLIGVGVSLLLLIPINKIIHAVTNNQNITAVLPFMAGIILIVLSTILTLIGGIIPSRKAAKQDPVLALRSE